MNGPIEKFEVHGFDFEDPDNIYKYRTTVARAGNVVSIIDRLFDQHSYFSQQFQQADSHIGIIGLGSDTFPMVSYEPYWVTAYFQQRNIYPHVTLFDRDLPILTRCWNALGVFVREGSVDIDTRKAIYDYQQMVQDKGLVLLSDEIDTALIHPTITTSNIYILNEIKRKGLRKLQLPHVFSETNRQSYINPVHGDISKDPPAEIRNLNLINCMNVLYHLPFGSQLKALTNMAHMLEENGILLINHTKPNPRLNENNSTDRYINDQTLQQCGLFSDYPLTDSYGNIYYPLRRL